MMSWFKSLGIFTDFDYIFSLKITNYESYLKIGHSIENYKISHAARTAY